MQPYAKTDDKGKIVKPFKLHDFGIFPWEPEYEEAGTSGIMKNVDVSKKKKSQEINKQRAELIMSKFQGNLKPK